MSESANLLQLRPPGRQLSSTLTFDQMCRHRTALTSAPNTESSSTDNPEQSSLDPHFLLDIFTLCSVTILIGLLILTRALKRRRLALSHQTKGTQTANPVLNLDDSINRLSSEMTTLHARLEHLEQERLEGVTSHRMQSPLATKTTHCTAESEDPNLVQSTWSGARPRIPQFETNPGVFQSIQSTQSVYFLSFSCV